MPATDVSTVRTPGRIAGQREFPDATLIDIRYAPHTMLPLHTHAVPLFLLTVAGNFEETVERRYRTCRSGQLIYRPAGERHSQRFGGAGAACLAVELPRTSGIGSGPDGAVLDGMHRLLACRLYDEFRRPTTETPLFVEETIATLLEAGIADTAACVERSPRWLDRVVDLIESKLSTSVRLRDLAAAADRHPVHVSRCFRQRYGCDVAGFVRRRRVHEASRLIRDTGESLSAIAVSTGFSDQSHMGRAFRAVMGRAPGEYRTASDVLHASRNPVSGV